MLDTMTVNTDRLNEAVHQDFSNATELADYLVAKYHLERRTKLLKIVFECIQQGIYLLDVPLERYKKLNSNIDQDVYDYLKPENCLSRRKSYGSTGQDQYVIN